MEPKTLADRGHAPAHWLVLADPRLTMRDKLVWTVLAGHVNRDGFAWPGLERVGRILGIAPECVCRSLNHLQECGYEITRTRRGQGRTNMYQLSFTLPRGFPVAGVLSVLSSKSLICSSVKSRFDATSNQDLTPRQANNISEQFKDQHEIQRAAASGGTLPPMAAHREEAASPHSLSGANAPGRHRSAPPVAGDRRRVDTMRDLIRYARANGRLSAGAVVGGLNIVGFRMERARKLVEHYGLERCAAVLEAVSRRAVRPTGWIVEALRQHWKVKAKR
jgi:hypothetical protein